MCEYLLIVTGNAISLKMLPCFRFLGAENNFNFFTVKKNSEAPTDDERRKLELCGQFHVGEMVNRFRKGSLVMKLPETEISTVETYLFCTTSGSLGVLATLPHAKSVSFFSPISSQPVSNTVS